MTMQKEREETAGKKCTGKGDGVEDEVAPYKKKSLARQYVVLLPVTPLVDVTFQLLLYFMICGVFDDERQIPGSLPTGRIAGRGTKKDIGPELETLTIRVIPTGRDHETAMFQLDGEPRAYASSQKLFERLVARRVALDTKQVPILIAPAPNVRWGNVVEAFCQCSRADYEKVGFAPSKE